MIIGIDASRAFLKQRTGIEEYSYQVIKHLKDKLSGHRVILYVRKNQNVDFKLPENWKVKAIKCPRLWTQLGLSLELLFHPVDILFIPAHTVPIIHPKNTIVTIHGLEYEFCPDAYSFWEKLYMRFVIKNSCKWAKKIIAVSNNTKQDLIKLYKVPEEKITIGYEGYANPKTQNLEPKTSGYGLRVTGYGKFLLFIGRLEERKNIIGIIKAFEILKEHYKIPHKLILAGKFGYGEQAIRRELENTNCASDIILPGYVAEEEKWELLQGAEVFLFPTFYEGFGLPILEAQASGVPVVAGNNSSIPEIVKINCHSGLDPESSHINSDSLLDSRFRGNDIYYSALLIDPHNAEQIADETYKIISDINLRSDIIRAGLENVKRFSWEKCAEEVAQLLIK